MTGEFIVGCITAGVSVLGSVLGSVAMVTRARPTVNPVYEVNFANGEKAMGKHDAALSDLQEAVACLEKEIAGDRGVTQGAINLLSKEVSEVRHGLNNHRQAMSGLEKKIDEMPANIARLVKALG
jgi:peptidoglycan hydrolase CwlO-like protein